MFLQKDLTASQIYMIYSIFSILIFLLEVPAGYLGDKIGYKKSIILGLICGILGFIGFIFGKGFRVIIIAYFLWL
ncbi:MFS transporter [Caloramator sp. mosi_1]|uniref:MFS transporter n=1 Tax=Caloramator sp. mosi_1 TaxID=3023090 RepID=UPI003FCD736A